MDGPGGNQPRRRAGDSNIPGTPSPIKDWQRNTWYGPAPQDSNPFEEPDEAPELLELRSDNVRQKSGEFWQEQKQQTGYLSATHKSRHAKAGSRRTKRNKKERNLSRILGRAVLITLALAAVTVAVLYFAVYRVRTILVEGNITEKISFEPKDIISLSGIRIGDSMLTLDEKKVGERLQSGAVSKGEDNQVFYTLQFRHLELTMPGTVKITVKVREPCCWVNLRGIIYVMDKERMILWVTENKNDAPTDLVQVKGLKVKSSNPRGGQILEIDSEDQKRIIENLFLEMKVMGCTEMIQEVDLNNPGSVTMTTRRSADPEGNEYVIGLGDCKNTDPSDLNSDRIRIHEKLRSFLLVWNKLHHLEGYELEAVETRIGHGINGGTINVKNPASPYYSPDIEK